MQDLWDWENMSCLNTFSFIVYTSKYKWYDMYRSHMTPSVLACFVCNLESFQPPSCLEKLWIFCLVDRSGSLLWRVWSLKGSPCFWAAAALEGQPTAWVQWMCIFLRFGQTILVEMIHEPGLLPQNQWDVLPFLPESWKWKMGPLPY